MSKGKFDEQAYNEGRADFANGMSLREIAESVMAAPPHTQNEDRVMSRALGFADAMLDGLRTVLSGK